MNQRNDNDHNGFEKPASETSKARPSVSSILTGVAAAATILTTFKDWTKNSPQTSRALVGCALALVLTIVYPEISRHVLEWKRRRVQRKRAQLIQQDQAAFVEQWQAKFDELQLLEKLNQFASSTGELSIISIVNSSGSYDGPFASFVFDPVYLGKWLPCFTERPRVPTSDIRSFIARCEEFIVIVDGFYQDYALKGKEKLENLVNIQGRQALSKKGCERFEIFQSKLNFYLQQVEDWRAGLEKGRNKVAGNDQFSKMKLQTLSSYQVGSLRQNSAEQLSLKPARADSD